MRLVFILVILFFNLISFGQNYSGMYPGSMHFYSVNGSNQLTSIREDSSYYDGIEFVKIPELLLRDVTQENISDTNCTFWGAPECQFKIDAPTLLGKKIIGGNNQIRHFNFYGDSLVVDFTISINDTQTVFQSLDTNLRVKYICLSKDTATLFGVTDSIILFTVISTDTLNNEIISAITGDTIIYSKNTGLYKGFSIDYFPISYSEIELKGIRNPNYGFYGMTYANVYDFQVGDRYEIYGNYPPGPYYLNEILNRSDSPMDVEYTILQIERTSIWNGSGFSIVLDTVTVLKSYSKISYIDEYPYFSSGNYKLDTTIFNGCYSGIFYKGNNYNSGMYFCPTQNCLGDADLFQYTFLMEQYMKGVGFVYGNYNTIGGSSAWKSLTFLDKQSVECGSSTVLNIHNINLTKLFSIFPNPTQNNITIQSDQPILNGKIILCDISGRKIAEYVFSNSLQLDLENYTAGIYFIQLYSENILFSTQKLIKE